MIEDEDLRNDATHAFIEWAFRESTLRMTGPAIAIVLPSASRLKADDGHGEKNQRVIATLCRFFERVVGLRQ